MIEIYCVLFFICGLIFGSFFNVVGLRVPKKQSISYPGSHCPNCQHDLAWFELIPVFSYLFLRGKCRSCHTKISPLYPIMEAITGLLFAFTFYKLGFSIELIASLFFISLLVIITVSDIAYMIIPDKVLLIFLIIFIIIRYFQPLYPWWDSIVGGIIGFSVLYIIALISRGGMGGGDIKLFFVIGVILGTKPVLFTLFFASFLGAIYGIGLKLLGKFRKGTPIPFGPFISISAVVSYFYAHIIIDWYLNLFI
ncbi:prepilin peptidase [Bacillus kwashiorkori]|uniref:prepilin peptidase n=1 Tax=Bacillus kwashiorkori TaxID=1522318 RepID=UPI000785EF7F|nr:A24 family peptidase [Bacillus kwashiorkori]